MRVFVFSSSIIGCWAVDTDDENLKPLVLPEEVEMNGDRSSMADMLRTFRINYLVSNFKPPSKEASIPQRVWSSTTDFLALPKNLLWRNKHPNACEWKRIGSQRQVTQKGEKACFVKCNEENKGYIEFANSKLPHLFNILNAPQLKAKFKGKAENIHKCASGIFYGFTCVCKRHAEVSVNEKLQNLINRAFKPKGKKEGESSDDEQEKPEKGGKPSEEEQENPEKEEEPSDEIEKNPDELNAVGKFLGLFAVLLYFPSWLYSYILWCMQV